MHHNINYSCNIKQWIGRLAPPGNLAGPLRDANPDAAGNQLCIIHEHKDARINLPPFYSQSYKVKDLLKKIEPEVSVARGHKKVPSSGPKATTAAKTTNAAKATSVESLNARTIIPAIEKEINCPIEKVLFQFVESTHIPANTLFASFRKLNKNIDKKLLNKFVAEASGGQPGPDGILFGDIVRLYINSPGKFDKQKQAVIQELAVQVDEPVRETLQRELQDDEDGISKDAFINSFQGFDGAIDKWKLTCLFYTFDIVDGQDESVDFETVVKIVSDAKGVRYQAPKGA